MFRACAAWFRALDGYATAVRTSTENPSTGAWRDFMPAWYNTNATTWKAFFIPCVLLISARSALPTSCSRTTRQWMNNRFFQPRGGLEIAAVVRNEYATEDTQFLRLSFGMYSHRRANSLYLILFSVMCSKPEHADNCCARSCARLRALRLPLSTIICAVSR